MCLLRRPCVCVLVAAIASQPALALRAYAMNVTCGVARKPCVPSSSDASAPQHGLPFCPRPLSLAPSSCVRSMRPFWHLDHITVWRDPMLTDPDSGVYFPCRCVSPSVALACKGPLNARLATGLGLSFFLSGACEGLRVCRETRRSSPCTGPPRYVHVVLLSNEKKPDSIATAILSQHSEWFDKDRGFVKDLFPSKRTLDIPRVLYTLKVRHGTHAHTQNATPRRAHAHTHGAVSCLRKDPDADSALHPHATRPTAAIASCHSPPEPHPRPYPPPT
jgi:hypothetical protein